jgi:hypothetical protein
MTLIFSTPSSIGDAIGRRSFSRDSLGFFGSIAFAAHPMD